ncbi:MAG: hypothetical protein IKJ72_01435, partial [Mycoplasmataceae bacterium]|nr:hypothetical protein [Mycoplasmataceae bacterium]
ETIKTMLIIHAKNQLVPNENLWTKFWNEAIFDDNQATKIITIKPKDIQRRDFVNKFDLTFVFSNLYFLKKLFLTFSIKTITSFLLIFIY